MTRQERLETLRLVGAFVRIGSLHHGPIYKLVSVDHSRDTFSAHNLSNGARSHVSVVDLFDAIRDGIAHIRGGKHGGN